APGRGAYLHRDPACWTAALRRGALSRALRTSLGPEEAGRLLAELEGATTE
ncbi:MAG: YlxR family protein, partial [Actinobacteria bacterium]|nr:YlxR family protein [Actinomycetota bacterium]